MVYTAPSVFNDQLLFHNCKADHAVHSVRTKLLTCSAILVISRTRLDERLLGATHRMTHVRGVTGGPLIERVTPLRIIRAATAPTSSSARSTISIRRTSFSVSSTLGGHLYAPGFMFTDLSFGGPGSRVSTVISGYIRLVRSGRRTSQLGSSSPRILKYILGALSGNGTITGTLTGRYGGRKVRHPVSICINPVHTCSGRGIIRGLQGLSSVSPRSTPYYVVNARALRINVSISFTGVIARVTPNSTLIRHTKHMGHHNVEPRNSLRMFNLSLRRFGRGGRTRRISPCVPRSVCTTRS